MTPIVNGVSNDSSVDGDQLWCDSKSTFLPGTIDRQLCTRPVQYSMDSSSGVYDVRLKTISKTLISICVCDHAMADLEGNCALVHKDAVTIFDEKITEIVTEDSLLQDLPSSVSAEDVKEVLQLELGKSIRIWLRRFDGDSVGVIIRQNGRVIDLKKAISRSKNFLKHTDISWRCIWNTYFLYFGNQKLTNDTMTLQDYGVQNGSEIRFIKRLKPKGRNKGVGNFS